MQGFGFLLVLFFETLWNFFSLCEINTTGYQKTGITEKIAYHILRQRNPMVSFYFTPLSTVFENFVDEYLTNILGLASFSQKSPHASDILNSMDRPDCGKPPSCMNGYAQFFKQESLPSQKSKF